jgi:hypothetical protein
VLKRRRIESRNDGLGSPERLSGPGSRHSLNWLALA